MSLVAISTLWLVFIFGIYYEYRIRKSPVLAFYLASGIVFTLPQSYSVITDEFSASSTIFITLWGILFFLCFILLRIFLQKILRVERNGWAIDKNHIRGDGFLEKVFFLSIAMGTCLILFDYGFDFSRIIQSDWGAARESASRFSVMAIYTIYISTASLIFFQKKGDVGKFFIFASAVLLLTLIIKSRYYLIAFGMTYVIYKIIFDLQKKGEKIRLLAPLILIGIAYLFTRSLRHYGSIEGVFNDSSALLDLVTMDSGEFELIRGAYYIYENGSNGFEFNKNNQLMRLLLFFIPSGMFGELKPRDFSYALWESYMQVRGVNGSFHVGVVFDSYFNDNNMGFLIYPLYYAAIFSVVEFFSTKNYLLKVLMIGPFTASMFYIGRGAIYNGVSILMISFFISLLLLIIFRYMVAPTRIRS